MKLASNRVVPAAVLAAAVPPSKAANCSNLVVASVEQNLISVNWGAPCSWPQNETKYYIISFIDTTQNIYNSTSTYNCKEEVCLLRICI